MVSNCCVVSGMRLIPTDAAVLRDPNFIRDRADMMAKRGGGGAGSTPSPSPVAPDVLAAVRPEALVEIREAAELIETTLLADGRDWVLGTSGPTLADIEAIWVLHWVVRSTFLSKLIYPGFKPRLIKTNLLSPQCPALFSRTSLARNIYPRCSRGSNDSGRLSKTEKRSCATA